MSSSVSELVIFGLGGMNGSIIYELDRPENNGLQKSVKVIDDSYPHVRSWVVTRVRLFTS